jgi:tripartite-type tricarboxylate transporter receptor subunit TctC
VEKWVTAILSAGPRAIRLQKRLIQDWERMSLTDAVKQGIAAMVAGEVAIMFELMPSAMPFVKSERLRALAVTSRQRSPLMPALPTIAETGLPGYEVASWFAVCAPAATPKPVVAKVNAEMVTLIKTPEMQAQLLKLGAQPLTMTPAEFGAFIKSEIVKWSKVVRDSGAHLD